jgi:WD40 repeat protein
MVLNGDPKGNNMLYANGKAIIIRDIANPGIADIFTGHSYATSVAQYAPSGYYIASGDVNGYLKIWDTTNKEHLVKYEYQPFAGLIKDISWSPDSKRIAICGQGRGKFGACILWDSGSTVGNISGHSKTANSITYRPTRPFRLATASDDQTCIFYEGPPFKYSKTMREHTRFINSIRFSPDGSLLCSAGLDGNAVLYDGKTAEKIGVLGGEKSHTGGIYAVSWSPDGQQLLTSSGDKTCKLWDVSTQTAVSTFVMGTNVEDQQLSCLWQNEWLLSVSLSGYINYLDKNNPDKPIRVLTGQQTNLSSLAISTDNSTLYCGSMDGKISYWTVDSGEVQLVKGAGHSNLVCSLAATPDALYSLGLDKNLKKASIETNEFLSESYTLSDRDPTCLAVSPNGVSLAGTKTELFLFKGVNKISSIPISYEATSACFHPIQPIVSVGCTDDKARVYSVEGDAISLVHEIKAKGQVNTVAYDPSGSTLAVSGASRYVEVFETQSYTPKMTVTMTKHTARINSIAWSPNGQYIASGGVDSNVCINHIETEKIELIKGAHPMDVVTGVVWVNDNIVASCGNDGMIRLWEFSG